MGYNDEGRGALFWNQEGIQRNPDRAPDYSGYLVIEGKRYDVGAWVKRSGKSGMPMLGLSVSEARGRGERRREEDSFEDRQAHLSGTAGDGAVPPAEENGEDLPF